MGIEFISNNNISHKVEEGVNIMAKRTEEQRDAQNAYMEKLQDIKVRVPKEYFDKIKSYATQKKLSINKFIISFLEKEIGQRILSVREQNKIQNEDCKKE